jgi:hypothetical protein
MLRKGSQPVPTMKSVRKPGFDRLFTKRRNTKEPATKREDVNERNEGLILLAIAFLFLANVVVYLCHHYGLTSLNDWRPQSEISARVITE